MLARIEPTPVARDPASACLNCGAPLHGPFCSACGQRVIPPYPRVREMVGDAWEELSGYDGRFARTLRTLVCHPGALTIEVLEGRRARYVSPVRLYLFASVVYFLVAAASPNLTPPPPAVLPGQENITIDLARGDVGQLPPEQREAALRNIARAPALLRPVLRAAVADPRRFRAGFVERLPRVLFALVPVFAAIVSLFYRRRRFMQHLVFALHLHAVVFIGLAVRELASFTGSVVIVAVAGLSYLVFVAAYALAAFRRVYHASWRSVIAKGAGIALLYLVAGIVGLFAGVFWTALS